MSYTDYEISLAPMLEAVCNQTCCGCFTDPMAQELWWREFSNAWRVIGALYMAQHLEGLRRKASEFAGLADEAYDTNRMATYNSDWYHKSYVATLRFAAEYKP